MSRSASQQFTLLSREAAQRFVDRCAPTGDSAGDRIAAYRRVDFVTTAEERAAVRAYNAEHGYDRRGHRLTGEEVAR